MGKRVWNPSAQKTVIQINSTLDMLQQKALCLWYNSVPPINESEHHCQITWYNHVSERANSGKSFLKIAQYEHILKTNSYHCLLFDGSLIRVNFEFEDNVLLAENLLWWPAPGNFSDILHEGFPPIDVLENFYEDTQWNRNIIMRSPIRIDFDCHNNTKDHPHSHIHLENDEARLNTSSPICFNRFIDFIFRNFYPQFSIPFSNFDFIKYKIPDLDILDYTSSHIIF